MYLPRPDGCSWAGKRILPFALQIVKLSRLFQPSVGAGSWQSALHRNLPVRIEQVQTSLNGNLLLAALRKGSEARPP